jgi:hypothetical protein
MSRPEIRGILTCAFVLCACAALARLSLLTGLAHAQTARTISIRIFDGRTAQPIVPSNFLVRIDHQDDLRNESLRIDSDGIGEITIPAGAAFLSVQGTYDNSMDIFLNCDAGMEKNTGTLHWYSIADILSTGVIAPNECYKGKYERNPRITPKAGELDFFVRKSNFSD